MNYDEAIKILETIAGPSTQESRDAVTDAFGGDEKLFNIALVWAVHHAVVGFSDGYLIMAFCTAVDLGVRIGKKETAKT